MAKFSTLFTSSLCLLAFASFTYAHKVPPGTTTGHVTVEGRVFCDTCQFGFENRLSYPLIGAEVKFVCQNTTGSGHPAHITGIFTDTSGKYRIENLDAHRVNRECNVYLVKSPDPDCNVVATDIEPKLEIGQAKVYFNLHNFNPKYNAFMANPPIAFMVHKTHPDCMKVLRELNLTGEPKKPAL